LPLQCIKSRKCSKVRYHVGKCNSQKQFNRFWEESAFYKLNNSQGEVSRNANDVAIRQAEISHAEQEIQVKRQEIAEDIASVTDQVATASMSHLL
jgi:hypothetical protein